MSNQTSRNIEWAGDVGVRNGEVFTRGETRARLEAAAKAKGISTDDAIAEALQHLAERWSLNRRDVIFSLGISDSNGLLVDELYLTRDQNGQCWLKNEPLTVQEARQLWGTLEWAILDDDPAETPGEMAEFKRSVRISLKDAGTLKALATRKSELQDNHAREKSRLKMNRETFDEIFERFASDYEIDSEDRMFFLMDDADARRKVVVERLENGVLTANGQPIEPDEAAVLWLVGSAREVDMQLTTEEDVLLPWLSEVL